jgi:hypothetical protein
MKHFKSAAMEIFLLFLLSISIVSCQKKSVTEDFIFKTEAHVDLLFHVLAHIDTGNDAANLYSEDYVKLILNEKQKLGIDSDLTNELSSIKDTFIPDKGLRMIDFFPFGFDDYKEFLKGLKWLATDSNEKNQNEILNLYRTKFVTTQEQRDFIGKFSEVLDHEYKIFYRDYWKKEQERLSVIKGQFEEFVKTNGEKLFSSVMKKEKKKTEFYSCLSMTRYGRGFGSRYGFGAAVKFPENKDEFLLSFITSAREIALEISTPIIEKAENIDYSQSSTMEGTEGFKIHMAIEWAGVYLDYLLFRKFLPEYLKDFLLFYSESPEKEVKDKSIEELENIFKTMVKPYLSEKSIECLTNYINKL